MKSAPLLILKGGIAIFSIYFIYVKVISRPDLNELINNLTATFFQSDKIFQSYLILVLMLVNWLLETLKWRTLLSKIYPVNWITGLRSVLSGVTVSLFTPNRVGEFAGRVLHLQQGIRIKASIASVIGGMNQLLITIICGGIGLIFLLPQYISDNEAVLRLLSLLILFGIFSITYFYFNIPILHKLAEKIPILKKLTLYSSVFELYHFKELLKISFISLSRYAVFSFQFILMLGMFDINLPYFELLKIISVIYLVMALVPGLAIAELTIRGSVALYFLSPLTGNSAGVLAATTLIWFVNLVVPAAFGALSAFYIKLSKI